MDHQDFHQDFHQDTDERSGTVSTDVLVVGAGLAGLTAAVVAARRGASVVLVDARSTIGGRARTTGIDGFSFNEGPHALYRAGEGMAVLRSLGISPAGGNPPFLRTRLALDGTLRRMPPRRATRQVLALLRRLADDVADAGLAHVTTAEWIEQRISDPVGRHLAGALVRVSTYTGDLSTMSADAAAHQLRAAMRGVVYLHGGWAQLVTALETRAGDAGVALRRGAKVDAVRRDGATWIATTSVGDTIASRSVIVATGGPAVAARLVVGAGAALAEAAASATPVYAACLDLGLRDLPRPSTRFALGIDRPTYASVHTPGARLAERGRHVLHVMHYEPAATVGVATLESYAQQLQPGFRDVEAARQLGVRRVVAFDRPRPGSGMRGRPDVAVADLPGVYVAGDWVGPDDLLGGAAIASGRAAGLAAARSTAGGAGRSGSRRSMHTVGPAA